MVFRLYKTVRLQVGEGVLLAIGYMVEQTQVDRLGPLNDGLQLQLYPW